MAIAAAGVLACFVPPVAGKGIAQANGAERAVEPAARQGLLPVSSQDVPVTADALVRAAMQTNLELAAARLELQRARARQRQGGLRPNPTLDIEYGSGRLMGSPEERDVSVGLTLPFELGDKRQHRIDVAAAELAVAEAEVADRERRLTQDVLSSYAEALAVIRELEITEEVHGLDEQATDVSRVRVEHNDAAPLELSLLLAEVDRLRARRALLEGRRDAALLALGQLIGAPDGRALSIAAPQQALAVDAASLPQTVQEAIQTALQRRPDLRLARLIEAAAEAGEHLAEAEATPDLDVWGVFTATSGTADLPAPLVPVVDHDRLLRFGVSIDLPFFNKNQGARAEAEVAVQQARMRRQYQEQVVRTEVTSAFQRVEAARAAIAISETGVIDRSTDNIRVIRAAYELGEFRITDLINEQRRLLDAQRDYTEALVEHYRAIVDLRAAMATEWRP